MPQKTHSNLFKISVNLPKIEWRMLLFIMQHNEENLTSSILRAIRHYQLHLREEQTQNDQHE